MTGKTRGWQGGIANRTWQRDRRGPVDGRVDLAEDVHRILQAWRETHGWQPGAVWNPRTGSYEMADGS